MSDIHANIFPFKAIVGQDEAKTVLILNAIDPTIGGALISGPKGSGKSLLVKAFQEVLPNTEFISGCPFKCNPKDPTNICTSCRDKGSEAEIEYGKISLVSVPLSITEDMLVGSLDIGKAVEEGVKALEPGLLAEANQGILYIDEVNLLPDHITDSILDAAASGWNLVEREGISVQHPSRFILAGTMNPEEGELRPQILDRFGIFAETKSIQDPEKRALVIERNEAFRRDPETFREEYKEDIRILGNRIQRSRDNLSRVNVPSEYSSLVAETCSRLKVDGFRPDIVTLKVARALASFYDRDHVIIEDMEAALNFTLGHRTRKSGLSPPPQKKDIRRAMRFSELRQGIGLNLPDVGRYLIVPVEYVERLMRNSLLRKIFQGILTVLMVLSSFFLLEWVRYGITGSSPDKLGLVFEFLLAILFMLTIDRIRNIRQTRQPVALGIINQDVDIKTSGRLRYGTSSGGTIGDGNIQSKVSYFGEDTSELVFGPKIMSSLSSLQKRASNLRVKKSARKKEGGSSGGRGTRVISLSTRGRYAWYRIPHGKPRDIAFVPTIKAAAAKQFERRGLGCMVIETEDLREKVREYSSPYSIVLLVDMSLSMIESVANIIQSIYDFHGEVYRRKDRVGLVVFKGSKAYTLQHPTRNLDLVVKKLKEVGASDFTPLAAGLFQSWKTLKQEKLRNKDSILHLYVISDGIVNVPLDKPISPLTRRSYNSEAHADSFDVLRLLIKEGVKVHIVNTNHNPDESEFVRIKESRITLSPTQFLKELARVSKGEYIGLKKN